MAGFPWAELAPLYDIWLPMSYQSERKPSRGYRDAYRYMAENIDRMRAHLGAADVAGARDRRHRRPKTAPSRRRRHHRASLERGAVGGSLYDWRTTAPDLWPYLQGFRA